MLLKTWYAVVPSEQLTGDPLKVTVHNTDFVLFRDGAGKPHAFQGYCPHRGCDLSLGSMERDNLICAFHGWQFNCEGLCVHIPANRTDGAIPASAKLTVYPACDHAGLTWIYTCPSGQLNQVPPLVSFKEMGVDGWTYVPFDTSWRAHFTRVVESVLDVSHLPFVHPETTGHDISPQVTGPDYSMSSLGMVIHPTPFAPAHPMQPAIPPENLADQTEIELLFPNQWMIRTPTGETNWMCTFLTFTPVDDENTDIFGIAMRNFELDSPFLDMFHVEHTEFVMKQDQEIVEHLRPMMAPNLKNEAHVSSDGPTIRFRARLFDALRVESKASE